MKILSVAIVHSLIFLFLIGTVLATSGACSYHSGVNCSAASYGKVVCNDGWVNSSVFFSDAEECRVSLPKCNYPLQPSCNLNEIELQKTNALSSSRGMLLRGGLLGSDFGNAQQSQIENDYALKYSACQNLLNIYQSQLDGYNSCNEMNKKSMESDREYLKLETELKLQATCLANGFVYNGSACITYTQSCQAKYGVNSYGDKQYCYCSVGFKWNTSQTVCDKVEIKIIQPTPIINTPMPTGNNLIESKTFIKPLLSPTPSNVSHFRILSLPKNKTLPQKAQKLNIKPVGQAASSTQDLKELTTTSIKEVDTGKIATNITTTTTPNNEIEKGDNLQQRQSFFQKIISSIKSLFSRIF